MKDSSHRTDEWYTPKHVLDSLGEFDLDPCAPVSPLYRTAAVMVDKTMDGLSWQWRGRVFLNPPYSQPLLDGFMSRMARHGNGIALLFNRCDSRVFRQYVLGAASAVKFLDDRIKFLSPDGKPGTSPRCGNILVAYGADNVQALYRCGLAGTVVLIDREQVNFYG